MKTLVATVAVGEGRLDHFKGSKVDNYFKKTLPSIQTYAEKIGADYSLETTRSKKYPFPAWQKLDLIRRAAAYDRVLILDADIIIAKDAPNIFEEMPGSVSWIKRDASIERFKQMDNYFGWRKMNYGEDVDRRTYYNTGVMLLTGEDVNKMIPLLEPPYIDGIFEQHYLNRVMELAEVKIYNLPNPWNYIVFKEETLKDGKDKWFTHFASSKGKRLLGSMDLNGEVVKRIATPVPQAAPPAPAMRPPEPIVEHDFNDRVVLPKLWSTTSL